MMMNKLGMIAVAGMLIAVIGMGHLGESAQPLAWGFAVCIAVLVHWVNSLQKQVDALKADRNQKEQPGD
jgi:hypothetical protein